MGSESSLWNTVRKNMKGRWEAERVENPASPGTLDVYYTMNSGIMGWVELKHVHTWPKRDSTIIRVKHFSPQQKSFLRRHGRVGGNVKVLIQIEKDYFLFPWKSALRIGEMVKEEFFENCQAHWKNRIDYNQLEELL